VLWRRWKQEASGEPAGRGLCRLAFDMAALAPALALALGLALALALALALDPTLSLTLTIPT